MIKHLFVFVLLSSFLFSQEWEEISPIPNDIPRAIFGVNNDLYLACENGFYHSIDDGNTWNKKTKLTKALELANMDNYIFASTLNNGLFRSFDKGDTWVLLNNGLPENHIHDICIFKTNIYVCTSNQVYVSADSGETWTTLFKDKGSKVLSIAVNDSLILIGLELFSLYSSIDNGKSWEIYKPNVKTSFDRDVNNIVFLDSIIFISEDRGNLTISTNKGKTWDYVFAQFIRSLYVYPRYFVMNSFTSASSLVAFGYHNQFDLLSFFEPNLNITALTETQNYLVMILTDNKVIRISKCIFEKPSILLEYEPSTCINMLNNMKTNKSCLESIIWIINYDERVFYNSDSISISFDHIGDNRVKIIKENSYIHSIDSQTFIVQVDDNPEKPIITMSNDTLYSSSDYGNQWYHEDTLIAGAVGQWHYPLYTGNYTVRIGEDKCISDMSEVYFVEFVSVEETTTENISISPNPASDYIEIAGVEDVNGLMIYDVLGEVVLVLGDSRLRGNDMERIDVSSLSPGLYFVFIDGKPYKFIKQE